MDMQRDSRRPVRDDRRRRNTSHSRSRRPDRPLNWACCLLIAVIFIGSVLQIWSLTALSGQRKQIETETDNLKVLQDAVHNAENELIRVTNISLIERKAGELGLMKAEDEEIRLVQIVQMAKNSDTNAQTAYSGGMP